MSDLGLSVNAKRSIISLNKDIHFISNKIKKFYFDRSILARLVEEFSRLVFDKLALDLTTNGESASSSFSSKLISYELEQQVQRVIIGRTRAAVRFFDSKTVPLSTIPRSSTEASPIKSSSRAAIFFSRTRARLYLEALMEEYQVQKAHNEGLGDTIKRLEEDNTALRHDIQSTIQSILAGSKGCPDTSIKTWTRLADVELSSLPNQLRANVASQRRMSALSQRRMSVSSTRPRSIIQNSEGQLSGLDTSFINLATNRSSFVETNRNSGGFSPYINGNSFGGNSRRSSVIASRRRSGAAFSDVASPGMDSRLEDTSKPGSSHEYSNSTPIRPRSMLLGDRYRSYDGHTRSFNPVPVG